MAGQSRENLDRILTWYFTTVYGCHEGPGITPFYCDADRVGLFSVSPQQLTAGDPAAIFQLFVGLAMYQARRDVLIMEQQRSCTKREATVLLSTDHLRRCATKSRCPSLSEPGTFVTSCSVRKHAGQIRCDHPDEPCPVREASQWFQRLGDHGKLPMSAYFTFGRPGALSQLLTEVSAATADPGVRAELLVQRFTQVHRVGRKLATLFVSALSTPALAPGLTPWFPAVDGNALVVVDTHAGRLIDQLRQGRGAKNYEAQANWLRRRAAAIDLRDYFPGLPAYSPRLVQQALYAFGSSSNRDAWGLPCDGECLLGLCPYHAPSSQRR